MALIRRGMLLGLGGFDDGAAVFIAAIGQVLAESFPG